MNDNLAVRRKNNALDLHEAIEEAEQNLKSLDHSPYSDEAFDTLQRKISEFVIQLINESAKTSRRRKNDVVSENDVESANQYLMYNSSSKISRNIGTIGGILFGGGLSTFLSMVVAGVFTTNPVLIALGLTMIGASMVSYQFAKE